MSNTISPPKAANNIALEILQSMYQAQPMSASEQMKSWEQKYGAQVAESFAPYTQEALNTRIKTAYESLSSGTFDAHTQATPSIVVAQEDYRTNEAMQLAAQKVAQILGMDFILYPTEDSKITPASFVLQSIEFTGTATGHGSTYQYQPTDTHLARKQISHAIAKIQQAGAGVLILDNIDGTPKQVQQMVQEMISSQNFEGNSLKGTHLGLVFGSQHDATVVSQLQQDYGSVAHHVQNAPSINLAAKRSMRPADEALIQSTPRVQP